MKKFLIILSSLLAGSYLVSAIVLNLSSGSKLDSSNWQEINNITTKINLDNNSLNINGKLVSNSKICSGNSCLGVCDIGKVWDNSTNSCIGIASTQETAGESCYSIKQRDNNAIDGMYWIDPDGGDKSNAFQVYCDMTTDDGGWTLIATPKGTWIPYRTGDPDYVYPLDLSSAVKSALEGAKVDLVVENSNKVFRLNFPSDQNLYIKDPNPVRKNNIGGRGYGYFEAFWGSDVGGGSCSKNYADVVNNSLTPLIQQISCMPGRAYGQQTCGSENGWYFLIRKGGSYDFSGGKHPCTYWSGRGPKTLQYIWIR